MQFLTITAPREPARATPRELHLLIEPEPWRRVFLRNLADLFRKGPPPIWTTARPSPYWEDALVHRPVAWARIRQSILGHILVLMIVLWINLWWLDHPEVAKEEVPQTTITHYELSEYLPAITPVDKSKARPAPPVRREVQKAEPEYAPQEIVSLHVEHSSKQQTIVQPSPNFLHQDVPLPNLIVNSAVPGAPVVSGRAMQRLPLDQPQVVPPPAQMVSRSQITFPVAPQPEVVPPASDMAAAHRLAQLPAVNPEVVPPSASVAASNLHRAPVLPMEGPLVVAPSQSIASRANQLTIPAQSPEIAPPPTRVTSRTTLAQALPDSAPQIVAPAQKLATRKLAQNLPDAAPQVVAPPQSATTRELPKAIPESAPQVAPPAPSVASRVLSALGIGAIAPQAVPPPQPVAAGASRPQDKDQAIGQLLALNARPAPPAPTLKVPEGNRQGEFAAGPTGTPGASARPETVAGETPSDPGHSAGTTSAGVFVGAPPAKITADTVVAGPPTPPIAHPSIPDVPSADRVDNQIFG
ncbi:MAG TPA: hypothetical protein VE783_02595, partial [Candidatus Limnocylindrales bacterium]|nr:hypothetical protein [Candidatus Limnocylindrales bacterium]